MTAQKDLKEAKSHLHTVKRRKLAAAVSPPAWATYPPPCTIPRDHTDPRFTQSFDVTSLLPHATYSSDAEREQSETQIAEQRRAVQSFYELHGYVVFSEVLSTEECAATEAEIWVRKGLDFYILPYTCTCVYSCRWCRDVTCHVLSYTVMYSDVWLWSSRPSGVFRGENPGPSSCRSRHT